MNKIEDIKLEIQCLEKHLEELKRIYPMYKGDRVYGKNAYYCKRELKRLKELLKGVINE